LKTDQRTFEKVANKYNKKDVPCYDNIQFPKFTVTGTKNLPSNFESIDWEDAKKVTKECIHHLEKARKNFEISGTHDSDIEDAAENNGMRIGKFTNYHYVVYWNLFADENQEFFATLTGELDDMIFNESSQGMADSVTSSAKKKWKNNKILVNAFHTSAVTDKKRVVMEEKRLTIDDKRNALLK
jgi:hypothetical protein